VLHDDVAHLAQRCRRPDATAVQGVTVARHAAVGDDQRRRLVQVIRRSSMPVSGFKIVGPNHEPLVQGKQDERRYTVGSKHRLPGVARPCVYGFHFSRCAIASLRFIVPPPGFRLMRVVAHEPVIDCGDGKYVTLALDVVDEVADPGPMLTGTVSTVDGTRIYHDGYLHQDNDAHPAVVQRYNGWELRSWYRHGRRGRCDAESDEPTETKTSLDGHVVTHAWHNGDVIPQGALLHRGGGKPAFVRWDDGRATQLTWAIEGRADRSPYQIESARDGSIVVIRDPQSKRTKVVSPDEATVYERVLRSHDAV
jgi:hypothetical protein